MRQASFKFTLKHLLSSPKLEFLMEAHNGISAKLVEETGFSGIWASGLTISASYGLRDCNEASWTQVLETVGFMSDCTEIPILMDADTGFGDFNNLRRLVKQLEKIQVGGICIEDKKFPKSNSFYHKKLQELETVNEFCGKIRAAKDSQINENFVVIARTEAFIVGEGIDEVLTRASKYAQAGADGILVHSKLNNHSQIEEFTKNWDKTIPIVIVPTTYHKTPTKLFEDLGVSVVIWANHNLRASILAMKKILKKIHTYQSVSHINDEIIDINEIFKLTNVEELINAEKKYRG